MSRVKNISPIGLPPIRSTIVLPIRNQVNYVDRKNKEIIRKLETLKKYEKEAITDEEKNIKIKYEKARNSSIKQNTAINQMRKELYGDLVTPSPNDGNKITKKFGLTSTGFFDKKNSETKLLSSLDDNVNLGDNIQAQPKTTRQENNAAFKSVNQNIQTENFSNLPETQTKKVNFNLPLVDDLEKLEKDENEQEINNLLNFVNNLDYEKYSKDLEIREALYLIKNKVEKDRVNNPSEEECKNGENNENINYEENKNFETASQQQQNFSNAYNFNQDGMTHEKDWDNSVKNKINYLKIIPLTRLNL
jgi:hypothetical protein